MAKIEALADVPNVAPLNGNNDKIETAFQNTLSRDGSTPNQMEANLDMNNNRILNLPDAVHNQEPITLAQAANIASVSVAFSRENVGAVLYPVTQAETDNSITPENYYYPPGDVRRYYDGGGDYAEAITNALKSGEVVRLIPNTDHPTSSQITYTGSCIIEGQNATISPDAAHAALVIQPAASGVSTTLSADAQINASTITVTSTANLAVGDLIRLSSTAAWHYNPNSGSPNYTPESMVKGELHRIQKITGSVLTLDAPLFDNYDISEETVTVLKLTPITVTIRDLTVDYPANTLVACIGIYQSVGGDISNVKIRNAATQGLYLSNCYGTKVRNLNVVGANRTSFGYGMMGNECYDVYVSDSTFSHGRRGIDFTGTIPSRNCGGIRCYADGTGLNTSGAALTGDNSGFGSHESSEYITWSDCTVTHMKNGFVLRGVNLVVDGCEGVGDMVQSFIVANRAVNIRVTNCRYSSNLRPRKTLDVVTADDDEQKCPWFVYIANPEAWDSTTGAYYHIADNDVADLKNGLVNFAMTTDSDITDPPGGTPITEVSGLSILNNRVTFAGSTATTTCYILDSSNNAFTLKNSYISGNIFRKESTTLTFAHPDYTIDSTVVIDQVTRGTATAVTDNSGITHGHFKTPAGVIVTTSQPNEYAAVSAITSTNFTIQLTKDDGTAGSSQTIYWMAYG